MSIAQLQDLFDRSCAGLLAQGKAAYDYGQDKCVYRAPDGSKCAVGQLVPNEAYNRSWDTYAGNTAITSDAPAFDDLRRVITGAADRDSEAVELLDRLQGAHDNTLRLAGIDRWRDDVREIALEIGLNTEVLDHADA